MRPADTSPEAWKVWIEGLRRMTPSERMQRAFDHSETVRRATEAGLRQRFPHATEREIFLRLADLLLGEELARQVYGAGHKQ